MIRAAALAFSCLLATLPAVAAEPPPSAKDLFGAVATPAPMSGTAVIGSYAKGCIAGADALPIDGPGWEVMRLSRNRNWGHPALLAFVERLAAGARADGWPGLLVGDMAQPRGGPMRSGHASHQIGLNVDVWLTAMPAHRLSVEERETMAAGSMLEPGTRVTDTALLTDAHIALIRRAALDAQVARIFVHPGIKQAMCERAVDDRAWLTKVRPWWGHDTHFHVRLVCPPGERLCQDQEPPPQGDGCGADLAWWLTEEPWKPKPPGPPVQPLRLSDLPAQCADVLRARGTRIGG